MIILHNETKKALNIYLGNELIFLNIKTPNNTKDSNITFDKYKIKFSFTNETVNFSQIYRFDRTKVYFKGDYLFTFGEKLSNGTFINKLDISLPKENNYLIITDKNITFENISYIILSGDGEYLFIQKPFFSFILALSGFMISLYGSYYYHISLMIHMFFLFNFVLCDIINFFGTAQVYIYFISFG